MFDKLFAMFDRAATKRVFPRITLKFSPDVTFALVRCGNNSRYTGEINIKRNGEWQGRIRRDDSILWAGHHVTTPEERDYIFAFASNPHEQARIYGQETGICCFCHAELTNAVSVTLGYGPICADNYGLPHSLEHIHTNVDNASLDVVLNGNLSELL